MLSESILPFCGVLLQLRIWIIAGFLKGAFLEQQERKMARRVEKAIRITGAAEHNLKSINLDIPRDKLVVITGISGSGKSSLAFDTIYAEGRRKYVESLSTYARQFLEQMQKPAVSEITGLPPTIAIERGLKK